MSEPEDRILRGVEIASTPDQIELVSPGVWAVRSQSGSGVYVVSQKESRWACICPDYTGKLVPCKHITAVQIFSKVRDIRESREESARLPRLTFAQRWPEYRQAQRAELGLFDSVPSVLVDGIEDPFPPKSTGRPRLPIDDLVY